jgi:tetratricopeptide (TPR) repeat protein
MQLDLFTDNRSNILLNIADEYLRAHDFVKALSTCEQVRDEYPENLQAPRLCTLIQIWHDRLTALEQPLCQPQQLKDLLDALQSVRHPALSTAVTEVLLEVLQTLPDADHIFLPPRFHCGHLLLELGRHAEAVTSFRTALSAAHLERGCFLGWYADALVLSGNAEDALGFYLRAFLEDPASVDRVGIKHPAILQLHQHCAQYADGIDEEGEAPWLPVWGWLQGVFTLPLHHPPFLEDLEAALESAALPTPRIWFDLLTGAEYFRTVSRDDRQMAAVRRVMKRVHEEMFDSYMQKIRGTQS